MFSKNNGKERQLVFFDCEISKGNPIFLNIGNHQPVTLFGGLSNLAVICSEGEIIIISREFVKNSPNSVLEAVFLPNGEKASSVAFCDTSIVVLSLNDQVFESPINKKKKKKKRPHQISSYPRTFRS